MLRTVTDEAFTTAGITYRQLVYWTDRGYLHPAAGSTLRSRSWPASEVPVAATMRRLVAAGLPPAVAARVARGDTEIAPGVRVTVD